MNSLEIAHHYFPCLLEMLISIALFQVKGSLHVNIRERPITMQKNPVKNVRLSPHPAPLMGVTQHEMF